MGYLCPCFTPKSEWGTVGVVQVLSHSLLLANFDHAEKEDFTTGEYNVGLRHLAVFHDTCIPVRNMKEHSREICLLQDGL